MASTLILAGELLGEQSARETVAPDWYCLNLVGLAHLLRAACRESLRNGTSQYDDGHLTGLGLTVGPSGQPGRIPNHGSYIGRSTRRQRRRFSHLPSRETLHSTIYHCRHCGRHDEWPSVQSWTMVLGGLVYSAEAVGRFVVEYARHVKSGSYRSHAQIFTLPIAMTTALLQTRQRAKALGSSPSVDAQMRFCKYDESDDHET